MTLLDAVMIIFFITFMFPVVCFTLSALFWVTVTIFGGKK